ncbi:hypothetical protein GGF32_002960 [Allomyces javanicus]|nr:hypothetical protein GGF32_002960 [Allomyces javanicus]
MASTSPRTAPAAPRHGDDAVQDQPVVHFHLPKTTNPSKFDDDIYLTSWAVADAPQIAASIDLTIHKNLLVIPWPYTEDHAREYITMTIAAPGMVAGPPPADGPADNLTRLMAIRLGSPTSPAVGSIGFEWPRPHLLEIGYWLAESARGRGLMPRIIEHIALPYAARVPECARVQITCFTFNKASARVAVKAGFEYEGVLRNWHMPHGVPIDAAMYSWNSTTYCTSMSRCVNRLQLNAPCSLDLQTEHNEPCSQNLICDPRSRTCVSTMTFWAKNMAWIISLIVVLVLGTICCCFCLGCMCFKSVKGAGKLSGKLPFTNRRDQQ